MSIYQVVVMAVIDLKRRYIKSAIGIGICVVSIMLLLLAITLTISVDTFITENLNNLEGNEVIREVILKYRPDKGDNSRNMILKEITKVKHIDSTVVLSETDNEIVIKAIVDDYSNVISIVNEFANKKGYEVIVKDRNIVNVEIVKMVNSMGFITLSIVIILTYSTILINIKSFIDDRKYEIALYKALGYQQKHIFVLLYVETNIMVLLSFIIACILDVIIYDYIIYPRINVGELAGAIGSKEAINIKVLLMTLCVCLLLVFISSVNSVKKISKISPHILLKAK